MIVFIHTGFVEISLFALHNDQAFEIRLKVGREKLISYRYGHYRKAKPIERAGLHCSINDLLTYRNCRGIFNNEIIASTLQIKVIIKIREQQIKEI